MSPQLINKVLNQNWFVSSKMKEICRSVLVFEPSNVLKVLHGIKNSAAKFIRSMNQHHKNITYIAIYCYCIVLVSTFVRYVNCDIEPRPVNNQLIEDDGVGAKAHVPGDLFVEFPKAIEQKLFALVQGKPPFRLDKLNEHIPVQGEYNGIGAATNNNKINNYDNLLGDVGFIHAFIASLSVIIVSELGDKTFFIAAIMAMRHPRLIVFAGAISALALMTVLSAVFGQLANLIPRVYTYYISTALFAIFGLKMIRDGYYMSPNDAQEELEEVQSDLKKREDDFEKETSTSTTLLPDVESGIITVTEKADADVNIETETPTRRQKTKNKNSIISRVLVQAFSMTFLAEWGDRSQLTTIILAARDNVYGVIVGGILGHAICTGLAVIGGRMIAQRISVRTVTIVGGIVFICFAFSAFFIRPSEDDVLDIKP